MAKKGPLDGIPDLDVDRIREIMAQSAKDWEERERKRRLPPEMPKGKCVICKGVVEATHSKQYAPGEMKIGGPPPPFSWKLLGYYCTRCGLKYEFLPPELLEAKDV